LTKLGAVRMVVAARRVVNMAFLAGATDYISQTRE